MIKIKEYRKKMGLSQESLAKKINVTQAALSGWENGKYEPDLTSLSKLSKILNCSIDELYSDEPEILPNPNVRIGDRLRELRKSRGLSQQELSNILNVNQTAISQWEQSKTEPSPKVLRALCKALNTTADYLLEGETENKIPEDEYITIEAIGEKGGRMVKRVKKVSIEDFEMIETILNTVEKKRKLQKHIHPDL